MNRNDIYIVAFFLLIIAVSVIVSLVKQSRYKKSVERDVFDSTSVTYEIKSTFAKTEASFEDTDRSTLRCAVCDTIIPYGYSECPNCGTAVQVCDACLENTSAENRKIELDIISDSPSHEKAKNKGVSSSSSKKPSGPVMIGSLKSTMGGGKSDTADK